MTRSRKRCAHAGCKHLAHKLVREGDKRNTLGKTHDCCARCCRTLITRGRVAGQ